MSGYDSRDYGNESAALGGMFQGGVGGAQAGSAFGPWGAIIGGLAGAGIGGMSGLSENQKKNEEMRRMRELAAHPPQLGPASQIGFSQFRRNQAGLIAQLEAMARGEGPSAAAIQMREAMDRAVGAQASAAAGAGGRGVNAGAAYRNASDNMAAVQAQGARDTSMIRAQEQAQALNELNSAVASGRQADENLAQFNAQQQQQVALANLQAKMAALGINSDAQLQALMYALKTQGPGLGTQIMAGGAQAMPSILQYKQQQKQMAMQQQQLDLQKQYMQSLNNGTSGYTGSTPTPGGVVDPWA